MKRFAFLLFLVIFFTACKSTSPIVTSKKGTSKEKLSRSEKRKTNQLAEQLIEKGFYLSLGDNVFKKRKFDFMSIPLNKLFLETDTKNTILIEDIYKIASQKFIISEDDLKEKIYSNFTTLFKKDGR